MVLRLPLLSLRTCLGVLLPTLAFSAEEAAPAKPTKPVKTPPPPPTQANVAYGSDRQQVLTFWKAPSDKPTPLVFFMHGGSWINGSPNEVVRCGLSRFLEAGISVVTIEYRKVQTAKAAGVQPPVQWPMNDAARALQFVRDKATQWGLDKTRVGLSGVSAGACTSLWLAMHNDLADPKSNDPISRESTRVLCAGVMDAQTTLDPKEMRDWFGKTAFYGGHAFGFPKAGPEAGSTFAQFEAGRESVLASIKEYSPIEQATADDPAICLFNQSGKVQDPVHGARFGLELKKKLSGLGVECHLIYPHGPADAYSSQVDFLIKKLTNPAGAKQ